MSRGDVVLMFGDSRLAGDEPEAAFVPGDDTTCSSSWQGGYKELSTSLLRRADMAAPESPYCSVRMLDAKTGEVEWAGELRRPDPASVDRGRQTQAPQALGWQACAEDVEDVAYIGYDREVGRWSTVPWSVARRQGLAAAYKVASGSAEGGAILHSIPAYAWSSAPGRPAVLSAYDAGPLRIAEVRGTRQSVGSAHLSAAEMTTQLMATNDFDATGAIVSANLNPGTGAATDFVFSASNRRLVELETVVLPSTNAVTDATWEQRWSNLGVKGDNGLPLHGNGPADFGLLASDVVPWLIERFGGGALRAGYVPETAAILPHLTQIEPGTLGSAVNAVNAFHGFVSAVWEDGLWDFHPFGTAPRSRTWVIPIDTDGVKVTSAGLDGSMLWNELAVYYQTPTGERRSVGPGGATVEEFDDRLRLDDLTHPLNAAGKIRRCRLEIGSAVTKEIAVAAGATCLSERNQSRRAGTITVRGDILDQGADMMRPARKVNGGDLVIVSGRGDDRPHRVVDVTKNPITGETTITLDDTRAASDVLLAHIGAQLVGRV